MLDKDKEDSSLGRATGDQYLETSIQNLESSIGVQDVKG